MYSIHVQDNDINNLILITIAKEDLASGRNKKKNGFNLRHLKLEWEFDHMHNIWPFLGALVELGNSTTSNGKFL